MDLDRIQSRVGGLTLTLAGLGLANFLVDRLWFRQFPILGIFGEPSLYLLLFSLCFFSVCTFRKTPLARMGLALGLFAISGPLMFFNGSENYYGFAVGVSGVLILHRFGFFQRFFRVKAGAILIWFVLWIFVSDQVNFHRSVGASTGAILFLVINLALLYFLFEEEVRNLMSANREQRDALAKQAAEIARLEPLSVLGQRVAHVTHSFKNNLNEVTLGLFYLEQARDPVQAAQTFRTFSKNLTDRIETILMVSQAGADLAPEHFDVARILEGIHFIYLQERTITERANIVMNFGDPVLVYAVRWDFILMVENIVKNALEALPDQGQIRIDLTRTTLSIANNGVPIAHCGSCSDNCLLSCGHYGRPGQTTKKGGSGHGLTQVFETCRKNSWTIKVRAQDGWTTFEIGLKSQ